MGIKGPDLTNTPGTLGAYPGCLRGEKDHQGSALQSSWGLTQDGSIDIHYNVSRLSQRPWHCPNTAVMMTWAESQMGQKSRSRPRN